MDGTADILRPFLDAARDQNIIDPDLADRDVADWALRIIASLMWFEGLRRDRDELIDFVRRFFVRPLLNRPGPGPGAGE